MSKSTYALYAAQTFVRRILGTFVWIIVTALVMFVVCFAGIVTLWKGRYSVPLRGLTVALEWMFSSVCFWSTGQRPQPRGSTRAIKQ